MRTVYSRQPKMPALTYCYQARIIRVVDGDTFDCEIHLGLGTKLRGLVRLLGVDTPEVRGEGRSRGLEAKAFAERWVREASGEWPLLVATAPSRERRYIADAEVWRASDGANLADALLAAGLARETE